MAASKKPSVTDERFAGLPAAFPDTLMSTMGSQVGGLQASMSYDNRTGTFTATNDGIGELNVYRLDGTKSAKSNKDAAYANPLDDGSGASFTKTPTSKKMRDGFRMSVNAMSNNPNNITSDKIKKIFGVTEADMQANINKHFTEGRKRNEPGDIGRLPNSNHQPTNRGSADRNQGISNQPIAPYEGVDNRNSSSSSSNSNRSEAKSRAEIRAIQQHNARIEAQAQEYEREADRLKALGREQERRRSRGGGSNILRGFGNAIKGASRGYYEETRRQNNEMTQDYNLRQTIKDNLPKSYNVEREFGGGYRATPNYGF